MVYFKMILQSLLLLTILNSCNDKDVLEELSLKSAKSIEFSSYEKQFCFKKIYQFSNKIPSESTKYYKLDTAKVYEYLERHEDKILIDKFKDFVSYTDNSKFYLLRGDDKNVLIAIGKAAGVSALGADYWNYLCYSSSQKKEIKFSSLINSPYSLFLANNKLQYIEVVDNIPRPASGEEINLTYTPLIINVYDLDKKQLSNLEINCY